MLIITKRDFKGLSAPPAGQIAVGKEQLAIVNWPVDQPDRTDQTDRTDRLLRACRPRNLTLNTRPSRVIFPDSFFNGPIAQLVRAEDS